MDTMKVDTNDTYTKPELISEYTGYDYLYEMCKNVRNESHSGNGYINPITPRLQYIMNTLASQGISYEFVPLDSSNKECEADNTKLANVIVTLPYLSSFISWITLGIIFKSLLILSLNGVLAGHSAWFL